MEESDYFKCKNALSDFASLDIEAEEARRAAIRAFYASNQREKTACKDVLDIVSSVILNDSYVNALEAIKILYDVLKGDKCLPPAALYVFFDNIPKTLYQNLLSYDFCPPKLFKSGNYHALNSIKFALEMPCILMLASNACPQAMIKFYEPLLVILFRFMESKVSQKCDQQELVISAQIRSLSFVCYTFKNGIQFSSPISVECFSQRTINLIRNFLASSPVHACDQRRSILEILRTFVTSQCRLWKELIPLLDEQLLVGYGKAQKDFCRPLALQVILEILVVLKGKYNNFSPEMVVKSLSEALDDQTLLPNAHLAAAKSLGLLMEHLSHSLQQRALSSFSLLLETMTNKIVDKNYKSIPASSLSPTVIWLMRLISTHLSQGFNILSLELQESTFKTLATISSCTLDPELLDLFSMFIYSNPIKACHFWRTLHPLLNFQPIIKKLDDLKQKQEESGEVCKNPDLVDRLQRIANGRDRICVAHIPELISYGTLEYIDNQIANQYLVAKSINLEECELKSEVWFERLNQSCSSRDGLLNLLISLEACQPEWPLLLASVLPKSPPKTISSIQNGVFKRLLKQIPLDLLAENINLNDWLRRIALDSLENNTKKHKFYSDMAYQNGEFESFFMNGIYSKYLIMRSKDIDIHQNDLLMSYKASNQFYADLINSNSPSYTLYDSRILLGFATIVMSRYCIKAQREMAMSAIESGGKRGKNLFTLLSCSSCSPPETIIPLINAVRNLAFYCITSNPESESTVDYYPTFFYLTTEKPTVAKTPGVNDELSLNTLIKFVEDHGDLVFINAIKGAIAALDLRPTHIVGTIRAVQFICIIVSYDKCPWNKVLDLLIAACFGTKRGGAVYALTHAICSRQKSGALETKSLPIGAILEVIFSVVRSDNIYIRVLEAKIAIRALQVISSMFKADQQRILGEFLYRCFYSSSTFTRTIAHRFYFPDRYGSDFDDFTRSFNENYVSSITMEGQEWRGRRDFFSISLGNKADFISFFEKNLEPLDNSVYTISFIEALTQLQIEVRYLGKVKINVIKCAKFQSHNRICGLLKLLCVTFDRVRVVEGDNFDNLIQRLFVLIPKILYMYTASNDVIVDFCFFEQSLSFLSQIIAKLGSPILSYLDLEMKTLDVFMANVCLFIYSPWLINLEYMKGIISSCSVLFENENNYYYLSSALSFLGNAFKVSDEVSNDLRESLFKFITELVFDSKISGFSFINALQTSPPKVSYSLAKLIDFVDLESIFSIYERSDFLNKAIALLELRCTNSANLDVFLKLALECHAYNLERPSRNLMDSQSVYPLHNLPQALAVAVINTKHGVDVIQSCNLASVINRRDFNISTIINYEATIPQEVDESVDKDMIRSVLRLLMEVPNESEPSYALSVFYAYSNYLNYAIKSNYLSDAQIMESIIHCIRTVTSPAFFSGLAARPFDPLIAQYLRGNVDKIPDLMRNLALNSTCSCLSQIKVISLMSDALASCFDIVSPNFGCNVHGELLMFDYFTMLSKEFMNKKTGIIKVARKALNDKRLAARAAALSVITKIYISSPDDIGGLDNEILAIALGHSDAEYRHLRMEALEKLVKVMATRSHTVFDLILAQFVKEAEGGYQSLHSLANLSILLDCASDSVVDKAKYRGKIKFFDGIVDVFLTVLDKLLQQQSDRRMDQFKVGAVNLLCFIGDFGFGSNSFNNSNSIPNSISDVAAKVALTWPLFASPDHFLFKKFLSRGNLFTNFSLDILDKYVTIEYESNVSPQVVSESLYVVSELVSKALYESDLLGKKYFELLFRHFSHSNPPLLTPLVLYTINNLSLLDDDIFNNIFNNNNLESLGTDIITTLSERLGSNLSHGLPGISFASALVLFHSLIYFENLIIPHTKMVELLFVLLSKNPDKLRNGYLVLDGVEYRLPSCKNINCVTQTKDTIESWGKHAYCNNKIEENVDKNDTFIGWIFMDYLYAVLALRGSVDPVFKIFSLIAIESNPCFTHALILATHWNMNKNTNKIIKGDFKTLCWGRWFGDCTLEFNGLPYTLDIYRLLIEPYDMRVVYHQIALQMLKHIISHSLIDLNDQSTFHSAVTGALNPDFIIRKECIYILDMIAPKELEDRVEFLFSLQISNLSYPALYVKLLEMIGVVITKPREKSIIDVMRNAGVHDHLTSLLGIDFYDNTLNVDMDMENEGYRSCREVVRFAAPALARFDWLNMYASIPCTPRIAAGFIKFISQSGIDLAFVESILISKQVPALPLDLIEYIAFTSGHWYHAISILSRQIVNGLPHEYKALKLLSDVYFAIGERDYGYGVLRVLSAVTGSGFSTILALEQHGNYVESAKLSHDYMKKLGSGHFVIDKSFNEVSMWYRGWKEAAKSLNKWEFDEDNFSRDLSLIKPDYLERSLRVLEIDIVDKNSASCKIINMGIQHLCSLSRFISDRSSLVFKRNLWIEHELLDSVRGFIRSSQMQSIPPINEILKSNSKFYDLPEVWHRELQSLTRVSKLLRTLDDRACHGTITTRIQNLLIEAARVFRKFYGLDAVASQYLSKAMSEFGPPAHPPKIAQSISPILFSLAHEALSDHTKANQGTPTNGVLDVLLKNAPSETLFGGAKWIVTSRDSTMILNSLKIDPLNSRSWFSWARLNDELGTSPSFSIIAYLVGSALSPEKAPLYIGRVLWLLAMRSDDKEVSEAFSRYTQSLNLACWEPWYPILISSLQRPERNQIASILRRILHFSPAPLCFHLRLTDKSYSDEITITKALNLILTGYEWFAREITNIGKPDPIDELKCIVGTLLEETLELPIDSSLPPSIKELIYDFIPSQIKFLGGNVEVSESSHPISTLFYYKKCLKALNQNGVGQFSTFVHDLSLDMASVDWSHLSLTVPNSKSIIVGLSNVIKKSIKSHHVLKGVKFIGSDGHEYSFLIHPLESGMQRRHSRFNSLQQLLNLIFTRHRFTRTRHVELSISHLFPLNSFSALVQHNAPSHSLQQLVEANLDSDVKPRIWGGMFVYPTECKVDSVLLMVLHKILVERDKFPGDLSPFQIISDIMPRHALLRSFAQIHGSDAASLHTATRDFAISYSVLSLLNFVLALPYTKPLQLHLHPDCRASQLDFLPNYRKEYIPSSNTEGVDLMFRDSVPFRYTPNIDALLGVYGRMGVVPSIIFSASVSLKKSEFHLSDILSLVMREDIINLYENKGSWEREALEYAAKNSKKVLDYLSGLSFIEGEDRQNLPIDHRVHSLVQFSSSRDTLASLKTTWQAWI